MLSVIIASSAMASDYEKPILFSAEDVLPSELLQSDSYQVSDEVRNDGFMNIYVVKSEWGEWEIPSTALLGIRLTEIEAMIKMREVEEDAATGDAVDEDVEEVKKGFGRLVDDPEGTLKGAASGVGKMFKLSEEAWKSRDTRDENSLESLGKAVSGYDKSKRQYAGQFHVDPYSTNQALHEELDRLASAATKGSLAAMTVKILIPGGLGLVVSATSWSHNLNELLVTKSEVEMRIINRDKLLAMEVDAELAEQFVDDSRSTTTHKTYVAGALETMEGVNGRDHFVTYFLSPPSEEISLFRASSAVMYAWYHKQVNSISRFARVGPLAVAIDSNGELVICAPLDHLLWTESVDTVVTSIDQAVDDAESVNGKNLILKGSISGLARDELEKRGWSVQSEVSFEQ